MHYWLLAMVLPCCLSRTVYLLDDGWKFCGGSGGPGADCFIDAQVYHNPLPPTPGLNPSTCDSSTFPYNISGYQVMGLEKGPAAATTADACQQACCDKGDSCNIWEFSTKPSRQSDCWFGDGKIGSPGPYVNFARKKPPPPRSHNCSFYPNELIGVGSFKSSQAKMPQDCCTLCQADGKCKAWTLTGTACYFKDNTNIVKAHGCEHPGLCVSGTC
jgi:hypothetical protein